MTLLLLALLLHQLDDGEPLDGPVSYPEDLLPPPRGDDLRPEDLLPEVVAEPDPEPDRLLLSAIVDFLDADDEDEARAALAPLGGLDDTRVLAALRYVALFDLRPSLSVRAAETLAERSDSRHVLEELIESSHLAAVREVSLFALAKRGDRDGGHDVGPYLYDVALNHRGSDLRALALTLLREYYPEVIETRGAPKAAGSALLGVIGSAALGAYTLVSIGSFAPNAELAQTFGGISGAALGGLSGYVYTQRWPMARQVLHLSSAGWGILSGNLLAHAIARDPSRRMTLGLGLLGELAGAGATYFAADELELSSSDVWVANLGGATGLLLAYGVLGFFPTPPDLRPGMGVLLGTSLAGLVGTGAIAKELHFNASDVVLSGATALEGLWAGAFGLLLLEELKLTRDRSLMGSGAQTGLALGLLGGAFFAQYVDPAPGETAQTMVLGGYGKLLGAGLGFLTKSRSGSLALPVGLSLLASSSGLLASALSGDRADFSGGDYLLVPAATAIAIYNFVLLAGLLDDADWVTNGDRLIGLGMVGTAAGGLGAMAAAQKSDASFIEIAMGASGIAWGVYAAATLSSVFDWSGPTDNRMFLLLGDAGLLASSLLVSPLVDVSPTLIAGANVGGLSAMALAAMVAAFVTPTNDAILLSGLVAGVAGMPMGAILTQKFFVDGSDPVVAMPLTHSASTSAEP